jgi:hypothetical protein
MTLLSTYYMGVWQGMENLKFQLGPQCLTGPSMPYPSKLCGRATPEGGQPTAVFYPLDTQRRTTMLIVKFAKRHGGARVHRAHPRRPRPPEAARAADQAEPRRRPRAAWRHFPQTSHLR